MSRITIAQIGPLLKDRRGHRGIRTVAAEIGISPATLSRLETGKQPDLDTFAKVCQWLSLDASEVLDCGVSSRQGHGTQATPVVYAHFRAKRTMNPETAKHLSALILAVQEAVGSGEGE